MTRGDTRRIGGAALLAALLLAAGPSPAFGQAGDPASQAVQAVLERSRRGPARAPSATAADLARIGSGSIPALLESLAATREEAAREAVLLALEHLPVLDLRAHVKRRTSGPM